MQKTLETMSFTEYKSCKKCRNDSLMNVNWSNSICLSCETNLSASELSGMDKDARDGSWKVENQQN